MVIKLSKLPLHIFRYFQLTNNMFLKSLECNGRKLIVGRRNTISQIDVRFVSTVLYLYPQSFQIATEL